MKGGKMNNGDEIGKGLEEIEKGFDEIKKNLKRMKRTALIVFILAIGLLGLQILQIWIKYG